MAASNENESPSLTLVPRARDEDARAPISDLIDEPTLATRLGISRSTLQSWRSAGRGPRFIKLGRMVRYRTADVDSYLRSNTRGTGA